jgi:hypothetical protein
MNIDNARRQRRRRVLLSVARGRVYVTSDLRAAVRRARQRLAAEVVAGRAPPLADWMQDLRQRGRAAGYASRRRLVVVRFHVDPARIKAAMVSTGARTVAEVIEVALLNLVLRHRARPLAVRRHALRRRRHPRPDVLRRAWQGHTCPIHCCRAD